MLVLTKAAGIGTGVGFGDGAGIGGSSGPAAGPGWVTLAAANAGGQQQRHDLNYSQRTHAEAIRSDAVWSVTFAAAMAPYASERIFEGAGSHVGAASRTRCRLLARGSDVSM